MDKDKPSAPIPWTAIVVSAKSSRDADAIQEELTTYQKKGIIPPETVILTISDPHSSLKKCVGSGGATMNALLYVVEQLSARKDFQVLTPDVLYGAKILVILHGRAYPFGGGSRAFTLLPALVSSDNAHVELLTNFIHLYRFVTEKLAPEFPDGLWVCSSDMIIRWDESEKLRISKNDQVDHQACIITVSGTVDYALNHGVVKSDNQGTVEDVIYMGTKEQLEALKDSSDSVALVSGIVYLSVSVAENLLLLQNSPVLESCTYLGDDVGSQGQPVSLFFDILLAMCSGVEENDFLVRGSYIRQHDPREMGDHGGVNSGVSKVRTLIWNSMRQFRITKGHFGRAVHDYLSARLCAKEHLDSVAALSTERIVHSIIPAAYEAKGSSVICNSVIATELPDEPIYILNSTVDSRIHLTGNHLLINIDSTLWRETEEIHLKRGCGLQLVEAFLSSKTQQEISPVSMGDMISIPIAYGLTDVLMRSYTETGSTYCEITWEEFFGSTGITPSDLWANDKVNKCGWTAKLFPVTDVPDFRLLFWVSESSSDQLEKWRSSSRISMEEIFENACLKSDSAVKRRMFYKVLDHKIRHVLTNGLDFYFLPYFRSASIDGYARPEGSTDHMAGSSLFNVLDDVAKKADVGVAARTFALIADLLGCLAKGQGGLRSGPAANEAFSAAFRELENGNIESGTLLLAQERTNWISRPDLLIRCARHYEGAAQICIRQAVSSAIQFISLTNLPRTPVQPELWFVTECPARIDLSGGWTDTPPIAYEKGGFVVNCGLLINGQRPVGCKVRRTKHFRIRLLGGNDSSFLELNELTDLKDYCIPNSPGALVKACLLFSKILDLAEKAPLEDQLSKKWSCGFDIGIWSNLPQGSGMGTSSILAGAIIATLWTATDRAFDHSALIHAVLCVEQMLTTGGGWQDQVGGIYGGFKAATSGATLPLQVHTFPIPCNQSNVDEFNSRILLVYTGKPRLAKNLLQNVVRNWYAREASIVSVCEELVINARRCHEAFSKWDMDEICSCISKYYKQKQLIAPGTEPASISRIIHILQPFLSTWTLAGAGGGGFLFCLLKSPADRKSAGDLLGRLEESKGTTLYSAVVDVEGMHMFTTLDRSLGGSL